VLPGDDLTNFVEFETRSMVVGQVIAMESRATVDARHFTALLTELQTFRSPGPLTGNRLDGFASAARSKLADDKL